MSTRAALVVHLAVILVALSVTRSSACAQGVALAPPWAPEAPAQPVVTRPVPADSAQVRFTTEGAHTTTIHVHRGDLWEPLCTVPCARRFHVGQYALGLSIDEGPVAAMAGRRLEVGYRDVTLSVRLDDRSSDRGGGSALIVGGLAVAGGVGGGCLAAAFGLGAGGFFDALGAVLVGVVSIVGFAGGLAMIIVGSVLATRGPIGRAEEIPDAAMWPPA